MIIRRNCWVICGETHFLDVGHAPINILKTLNWLDTNITIHTDSINSASLLKFVENIKISTNLENFANIYANSTLYTVKGGILFNKEQEFHHLFKVHSKSRVTNKLLLGITKILSVSTPDLYIKRLFDLVSVTKDKLIIISKSIILRILVHLLSYQEIVIFVDDLEGLSSEIEGVGTIFLVDIETQYSSANIKDIIGFACNDTVIVNLKDKFQISGTTTITPLPSLEAIQESISDSFILFPNPLVITGKIVKGKNRGSNLLGIPTANIDSTDDYSLCIPGVYFGYVQFPYIGKQSYFASTSIGYNIHFSDPVRSIESYIHHTFDTVLVGYSVKLELRGYIRSEASFTSLELLIETIRNDCNLGNLIDCNWGFLTSE